MSKLYNRIVLVGNGFDLAAGLKTSYTSFIEYYIKKALVNFLENGSYESDLFSINKGISLFSQTPDIYVKEIMNLDSIESVFAYIENKAILKYHFSFFEEVTKRIENKRWVDIEQFYFDTLFNKFKLKDSLENIKKLNFCMDSISEELQKYIRREQALSQASHYNSPLLSLIKKCYKPLRKDVANLIPRHSRIQKPQNVIFLNFNYTNTLFWLAEINSLNKFQNHIHIHGSVESYSNPVIFGYGDDTNKDYLKLEAAGENDLLKKIKSFEYPRTKNYHRLLSALEGSEFDVFIIGHSCGLSDRTLLKTIFEHPNCLAIQNFHYRGESEDFYKRMDISRHFTDKALMRERVLPYDEDARIPQK